MSLRLPIMRWAYGQVSRVCFQSVCAVWDPIFYCFNLFQRVANAPVTMRCHLSCNHSASFLSGLYRNEKLQAGSTLLLSLQHTVGNICTTALALNNSTFCPHSVFMCFVRIWEQTAIISLYSINWLVLITETECVYCVVRTGSLYNTDTIRL